MPDRDKIISKLKESLEPLPFVYAFWLEGADAVGEVDEYSDLDFWVDFEDEYEEQAIMSVENALSELAGIDYKYISPHGHPKIRQNIYHLAGTSEYLAVDFCWQLHSRNDYAYYEDDSVEGVKVIFDKIGIIRYTQLNLSDFAEANQSRFDKAKHHRTQYARAEKYIRRGQYLEAFDHYNHYVLNPLIDILRLIYTPAYADYRLCHISNHIPEAERKKLEYFAQISSLEDVDKKLPQAGRWFDELINKIEL